MLRRRRNKKAKAPGEAKSREEKDEETGQSRNTARGVLKRVKSKVKVRVGRLLRLRKKKEKRKSTVREYAEAILTALLLAFAIRSFVVEAFKIPSSSMVPTLLVGDHIFVNKFIYGLRIPLTKKWVAHFRTPARGEVIVFIYPKDEGKDFIKRVVGLPGDKVRIVGRDIFVNDIMLQKEVMAIDGVVATNAAHLDYFMEATDGISHYVQHEKQYVREGGEYTVPTGHLFVMGDNRDGSADSREWGFVPMENLKGKAMFIWLSWDGERTRVRWDRFGRWIR